MVMPVWDGKEKDAVKQRENAEAMHRWVEEQLDGLYKKENNEERQNQLWVLRRRYLVNAEFRAKHFTPELQFQADEAFVKALVDRKLIDGPAPQSAPFPVLGDAENSKNPTYDEKMAYLTRRQLQISRVGARFINAGLGVGIACAVIGLALILSTIAVGVGVPFFILFVAGLASILVGAAAGGLMVAKGEHQQRPLVKLLNTAEDRSKAVTKEFNVLDELIAPPVGVVKVTPDLIQAKLKALEAEFPELKQCLVALGRQCGDVNLQRYLSPELPNRAQVIAVLRVPMSQPYLDFLNNLKLVKAGTKSPGDVLAEFKKSAEEVLKCNVSLEYASELLAAFSPSVPGVASALGSVAVPVPAAETTSGAVETVQVTGGTTLAAAGNKQKSDSDFENNPTHTP